MSDETDLAHRVSTEAPWWSTAPIYLAAGIVGVPSLIAIGAGYFVAHYVTKSLSQLNTFAQSELYMMNEHNNDSKRNFEVVIKFIDDDLKVQYQTCLAASKTDVQRAACISPRAREEQYGLVVRKRGGKGDPPDEPAPHNPSTGPPDP
jgi:hypothetical protein